MSESPAPRNPRRVQPPSAILDRPVAALSAPPFVPPCPANFAQSPILYPSRSPQSTQVVTPPSKSSSGANSVIGNQRPRKRAAASPQAIPSPLGRGPLAKPYPTSPAQSAPRAMSFVFLDKIKFPICPLTCVVNRGILRSREISGMRQPLAAAFVLLGRLLDARILDVRVLANSPGDTAPNPKIGSHAVLPRRNVQLCRKMAAHCLTPSQDGSVGCKLSAVSRQLSAVSCGLRAYSFPCVLRPRIVR